MSQYKITSSDFISPGETGDNNAVIDLGELDKAANKSKLAMFMQQQIAARMSQPDVLHENLVTIELREQKYDVKK
jgi:hypothetical protein